MQTSPTASPRTSLVATSARTLVLNPENLGGSCMVCISGVTDPAYTQACLAFFLDKVGQSTILHDVGLCFEFPTSIEVLISRTQSPGYLTPAIIAPCCFNNSRIVNFVHLHGDAPQDIVRALNLIRDECGLVHGIRIDIPGITPEDIRGALQGVSSICLTPFTHEIVLTLNHRTLANLEWDSDKIVQHIRGFIWHNTQFPWHEMTLIQLC